MNNATMIERLNELKNATMGNYVAYHNIETLIDELKQEERAKGFSGGEKERYKLTLSIQNSDMRRGRRPILALWHKNKSDNKYCWTNSTILVRLDEKDFFKDDIKTTADTFNKVDKKGNCYFSWDGEESAYPNTNNCWLKVYREATIDMQDFMAFLKSNKGEEISALSLGEITIYFNANLIYNALVLSKVAQQKTATLKYVGELRPFQFDDNCLCTPIRLDSARSEPRPSCVYVVKVEQ